MGGIFGGRRKQKGLAPPRLVWFAVVVVDDQDGTGLAGAGVILSTGQQGQANGDGYVSFQVPAGQPFSWTANAAGHVDSPGGVLTLADNLQQEARLARLASPEPVPMPAQVRRGATRQDGRSWRDDAGLFYPLGATLFWALSGWQQERDRIRQNWAFLRRMGWDYQRVTGDLDWAGQDASRPEFEADLGAMVDAAWQEFGLRTEITAFAGPSPRDPLLVARKVRAVAAARPEQVLFVEAANESAQSGPPDAALDAMLAELRQAGVPVAGSTPMGDNDAGQWNAFLDARRAAGATVDTVHLDRSTRDDDWGFVRQPWDFRGRGGLGSNNEGKGPRSSVAECTSVSRLVAYRAVSILAGLSAFVLHNGAGVAGKVDPAHDRPANLWEVPGIEDIMRAVRALDGLLPAGIESWQKTTQHGGWGFPGFENFSQVLTADGIWSDGHPHGCSRCYGSVNGNRAVGLVYGVSGFVLVRAERDLTVVARDLVTGATAADQPLTAGSSIRLEGQGGTDAAYVLQAQLA